MPSIQMRRKSSRRQNQIGFRKRRIPMTDLFKRWHLGPSRLLRRVRLSECLAGGRAATCRRANTAACNGKRPKSCGSRFLAFTSGRSASGTGNSRSSSTPRVLRINRTAARIHEGDVIKITYVRHRRERPLPGPGEPPLLERGKVYPAFLFKVERERLLQTGRRQLLLRALGGTAAVTGALRRIL